MKTLLQRVKNATVMVANQSVASIDVGILVFIGIEKNDNENVADKMLNKILNYRLFTDFDDKMNLSALDINAEILLVSQFTLAANTKSGTRAGFSTAMEPQKAKILYQNMVDKCIQKHPKTASGIFGADMQISLINDGPISFILEVN